MKLSEAMMLGDVIMSRDNRTWLNREKNCGCGLGRAYVANGGKQEFVFKRQIEAMWPWLEGRGDLCISGKFVEVCRGTRTFESLVEDVRSAEPDCGECNRFDCTCEANKEQMSSSKHSHCQTA